jgi:hypothetical protein
MAITTKRRRKIQVNGRQFVWWVAPDDDSADLRLHMCSTDKHFLVHEADTQGLGRWHAAALECELEPRASPPKRFASLQV